MEMSSLTPFNDVPFINCDLLYGTSRSWCMTWRRQYPLATALTVIKSLWVLCRAGAMARKPIYILRVPTLCGFQFFWLRISLLNEIEWATDNYVHITFDAGFGRTLYHVIDENGRLWISFTHNEHFLMERKKMETVPSTYGTSWKVNNEHPKLITCFTLVHPIIWSIPKTNHFFLLLRWMHQRTLSSFVFSSLFCCAREPFADAIIPDPRIIHGYLYKYMYCALMACRMFDYCVLQFWLYMVLVHGASRPSSMRKRNRQDAVAHGSHPNGKHTDTNPIKYNLNLSLSSESDYNSFFSPFFFLLFFLTFMLFILTIHKKKR